MMDSLEQELALADALLMFSLRKVNTFKNKNIGRHLHCFFFFVTYFVNVFLFAWTEDQNSFFSFNFPNFVRLSKETFLCSSAMNMQYSALSLQMFTEGRGRVQTVTFKFILAAQNAAFTSSCKKTALSSSAKSD